MIAMIYPIFGEIFFTGQHRIMSWQDTCMCRMSDFVNCGKVENRMSLINSFLFGATPNPATNRSGRVEVAPRRRGSKPPLRPIFGKQTGQASRGPFEAETTVARRLGIKTSAFRQRKMNQTSVLEPIRDRIAPSGVGRDSYIFRHFLDRGGDSGATPDSRFGGRWSNNEKAPPNLSRGV